MPRIPGINSKTLISFLKSKDFLLDHASGSHFVFFNSATKKRVTIPVHPKDVPKGTLFSILREAGFTRKDLLDYLN